MQILTPSRSGSISSATSPVRVMLVDDSAVIRGVLTRWIEAEEGISVVASCMNGRSAVDAAGRANPDVIVLDIEMPEMDGMTALPLLLAKVPGVRIVMASTLTLANAEISIRALTLGAADYLAKPSGLATGAAAAQFKNDLIAKIRSLGTSRSNRLPLTPASSLVSQATKLEQGGLRPMPVAAPGILAIGSSTGGPQALQDLLAKLPARTNVPILITQHMPPTFTAILAQHLARATGRSCAEAVDGDSLEADRVYVAPGDRHLLVSGPESRVRIRLSDGPPENFCRPSVDPMFRSIADAYGTGVLAIVLTGMGSDGREGARSIAKSGGHIVVQDEASSVVWGMPGAVAHAGLASAILPVADIAKLVVQLVSRSSRP